MIMEAEKFHDLSSAPWRPREASGIVPVQTQHLRVGSTKVLGQKKWIPQLKRKKFALLIPFLFYSSPQWMEWCPPALVKAYSLLNPLLQISIFYGNTFTDIPMIMFYQLSGHPLAQSSWQIKLTIKFSIPLITRSIAMKLIVLLIFSKFYLTPFLS